MDDSEARGTFTVNLLGETPKEQWINGMIFAVNALVAVSQGGNNSAIEEVRSELIRCISGMGDLAEEAGVWND